VFNEVYDVGDRTVNALMSVVLDGSAWPSETTREEYERDVFGYLLQSLSRRDMSMRGGL
jgi:hypothetical protein